MPGTFEDVVELLVPELRRRGLFWSDYCVRGGSYRENLHEVPQQKEPLPDHPAAKLIWRPSPKRVGFAMADRNGVAANGNGHLDFEERLEDEDLVDPTAMQLG